MSDYVCRLTYTFADLTLEYLQIFCVFLLCERFYLLTIWCYIFEWYAVYLKIILPLMSLYFPLLSHYVL